MIIEFVIDLWAARDHLSKLVENKIWIVVFPDEVTILNLPDCSDDSHTEKHVLRIINEVSAIKKSFCDVNDTDRYQLSINPMIEMVGT